MKDLYNINKKGLTIHVDRTKLSKKVSFQKVFVPSWLLLNLSISIILASIISRKETAKIEKIEKSNIHPFLTIKTEYTAEDYENAPIILIEAENELTFGEHDNSSAEQYIKDYLELAKQQEKKHNIPASITLAQGIHESNAGKSKLAVNNNNHFGIKCFDRYCKKGHCVNYKDDSHKDFFMNFKSGWACYNYRSKFLHKDRYKHLMKLKKTDYKSWANGLQKAGYATDKNYAKKLIRTIEKYDLHKL